ncbi:MAG: hypothetical protein ACKOCO_13850, partial [Bacteroidota bacterium]
MADQRSGFHGFYFELPDGTAPEFLILTSFFRASNQNVAPSDMPSAVVSQPVSFNSQNPAQLQQAQK